MTVQGTRYGVRVVAVCFTTVPRTVYLVPLPAPLATRAASRTAGHSSPATPHP